MNTYNHVKFLKRLFTHLGLAEERIQQYFCSAAEVEKFVKSVKDISSKVEKLPPLSDEEMTEFLSGVIGRDADSPEEERMKKAAEWYRKNKMDGRNDERTG